MNRRSYAECTESTQLSGGAIVGKRRGPYWRPGFICPRGTPRNDHCPPREERWHLHRAAVCCRRAAACRRFHRCRYVKSTPAAVSDAMGRGEVDMSLHFAAPLITGIDAGAPITVVAGVHVGCFELFAHEGIRSIRDLKGTKVGVQGLGLAPHVFLASMAAYVGLDPVKDIDWVLSPSVM